MRYIINYVLQDKKVTEGYVTITGPYAPSEISVDGVYKAFLDEKQIWGKDSGRLYAHNVISFHKDEQITPAMCLDIGKKFCERFFPDHQTLIAVHQDREHLHVHMVTNTVSFIDGRKLHQTKHDLQRQKDFTNNLCRQMGLTVAEKGKHFDGTDIEPGEIRAWSKDKYQVLTNKERDSYMVDCASAIVETIPSCTNADDFFIKMEHRGWIVSWNEKKTHIVFRNTAGKTIRHNNLSRVFSFDLGLEELIHEYKRAIGHYDSAQGSFDEFYAGQAEALLRCIAELLISALKATLGVAEHSGTDKGTGSAKTRSQGQRGGIARDERAKFDAFLADIRAKTDCSAANRKDRESERERHTISGSPEVERDMAERKERDTGPSL